MSITEIKQAIGGWELRLREDTPQQVLDALTFFGHIAILPGEVSVAQYGNSLLASARYVGVYRGRDAQDTFTLKGSGLAFWLGDEDGKGDIFETPVVLTTQTFANSVRALLPPGGSITEGVLNSVPGTLSQRFQWQNSREAIGFVTDTFGAEYRVNYDGTLDAGTVSQLYVTTPKTLLMRKGFGADLLRKAIGGQLAMGVDVEDVTTRVVLLAEGEGTSIATGNADAPPTPYKDLHGNPIKVTRIVSESGTEAANAAARAQLQLNRFLNARRSVSLSSNDYDIKGTFVVGDYLDVYDPENGFYDAVREAYWQGERINPMALRCVEMSWPVPTGWTVAFRDINGNWIDLSPYYIGESGDTTIVVGELARGLSSVGGEAVGVRPNLPDSAAGAPDTTIPAAPAFTDISTGSYQPENGDWTKAAVFVSWNQPLNSDGSVITDGGHYEIRYRVNTWIGYQVRWGMLGTTPPGAGYRWGQLSGNRWGAPITDPVEASQEWNIVYVGWGQTQMLIQELTPGMEYEFQIRAVDSANPPKQGPWSASEFVVASEDLFAPDVPAAPVVASSRLSIQVIHTLGKASGGTFNLQPDLVYLSVHVGGSTSFFPDDSNVVGKLIANSGMIQAGIPAIGTFQIEQTDDVWVKVVAVDRAGNKSGPSDAVQASVELIDDAHISDLTATKITAGTIMAQLLLAGSIKTAETGARVELSGAGVFAFNSSGEQTVAIRSVDGSGTFTGELQTELNGVGTSFVTVGGRAYSRWSVNTSGGAPLDHIVLQKALDYGGTWGQGFETGIKTRVGELQDGGKVLMSEVTNIFSHQPTAVGGQESFLALGRWPATGQSASGPDGMIYLQGRFGRRQAASAEGAIWTERDPVAAGFGASAYLYGPTMLDQMCPVYSITGVNTDTHSLVGGASAPSATGFNVQWAGTAAHNVYVWAFRMDNA